MEKIEQYSLLTAFFAVLVAVVIGLIQVVSIVPDLYKAPLALFLVSLLVFGVSKIIRASL